MNSPVQSLAEAGSRPLENDLRGRALRTFVARWRWLRIAFLAALIGLGAVLGLRSLGRPRVLVARVEKGTALEAIYATGSVEAVTRVAVRARVAGPVTQLLVREGARVAAGELLAVIDAPVLHNEVIQGESDFAKARERVAPQVSILRAQALLLEQQIRQARADYARAEEGARTGVNAVQEMERARLQIAALESQIALQRAQRTELTVASRSEVTSAEARLRSIRARAEEAELRSPIAGLVLGRSVELGEFVSVNQELFRIADTSQLQIEALADESDIGAVREGMEAAVRIPALPQRPLRARVRQMFADGNRERRAFRLNLDILDPAPGLQPGMSADCNVIIAERPNALLVPGDAVQHDKVWLVSSDGTVQQRSVQIGLKDVGRVEISDGLAPGDLVVVGKKNGLADASKVSFDPPANEAR